MRFEVFVPEGLSEGDVFDVPVGPTASFEFAVPKGCTGGELIEVELPGGADRQTEEELLEVVVPDGYEPGNAFLVDAAGRQFEVVVPDGCGAGSLIAVDVPAALSPRLRLREESPTPLRVVSPYVPPLSPPALLGQLPLAQLRSQSVFQGDSH